MKDEIRRSRLWLVGAFAAVTCSPPARLPLRRPPRAVLGAIAIGVLAGLPRSRRHLRTA
jgi:hypothetical protein